MGLLDKYLDATEIDDEPIGYDKPKDGTYEFEIGDASIKEWSKNGNTFHSFVIDYYLTDEDGEDAPKTSDFLTLPEEDADPEDWTAQEKRNLRTLRDRFATLGFDKSAINNVDREELVGLTGTLTLKTNAKGYQNIVAFAADEGTVAPADEPEEKPKAAKTSRRAGEVEDEPDIPRRRRGARAAS